MIEAIVADHVSQNHGTAIQKQHREISIASASLASSSTSQSGAFVPPVPSIIDQSPHSISLTDPQDRSPSNMSSEGMTMEVVNLAKDYADHMTFAVHHMHLSRSILTPAFMQKYYPRMFANAMASDFSEEAVPVPGDKVGSGSTVGPDNADHFAWPIELGMSAGLAHVVAFGRGMVKEYAEGCGYEWSLIP
jgi:hypothetical protein